MSTLTQDPPAPAADPRTRPWWAAMPVAMYLAPTDLDPAAGRIMSAALVHFGQGPDPQAEKYLINPGVPVPSQAAGLYGITTAQSQEGGAPDLALDSIAGAVAGALRGGRPLIVVDAVQLTLLDTECRRHQVATVAERLGAPVAPVIDLWVLGRIVRVRGELSVLCRRYAVRNFGAYDPGYNALAAGMVARKMAQVHQEFQLTGEGMHAMAAGWVADDASRRRQPNPGWPVAAAARAGELVA